MQPIRIALMKSESYLKVVPRTHQQMVNQLIAEACSKAHALICAQHRDELVVEGDLHVTIYIEDDSEVKKREDFEDDASYYEAVGEGLAVINKALDGEGGIA